VVRPSSALRNGVDVAGAGVAMQSLTGEDGPGLVAGAGQADFVRQDNAP
jgi:hypothetical protein